MVCIAFDMKNGNFASLPWLSTFPRQFTSFSATLFSQNTSGSGDEPRAPQDQPQDELRNSSGGGLPGYYQDFAKHMSMRMVVQSDRVQADDFVNEVIQNAKLPDMTAYDVVMPLSEGNQGDIYKMVVKAKPYVLKIYKSGLHRQYTEFQKDLLKHIDNPEAKAHPGYEAVYFAALPVGWATHMGKKGLVFRYVAQAGKSRRPNAGDRAQVRDQINFLHWLGYVHLDITDRNILLARNDKCYLMDFDCVCKIGDVPLGPLPKESSEPIMRRDPAELGDDDHLWQHLQITLFKDLSADEVKQAPVEVKQQQQQAPGEGLVH